MTGAWGYVAAIPRDAWAQCRADWYALQRHAVMFSDWLARVLPELLFGVAFFGGWALVTWAASPLGGWVWKVSGGLLLLSCCGWKVLRVLAVDGLYALYRSDR